MSQQNDLGKVALTPKGAFNATATYEDLDVVTYNGSSYLVLQTVTGVTPPNSTYYQTIASKGNNGTNGEAATITAGSITMLPYGSNPTVNNSGTANSAVFDFAIPYSSNLGDAGITSISYVTEIDTTTVTTSVSSGSTYPYATVLSQDDPDALYSGNMYRITFDNTVYTLPCLDWYSAGSDGTTFTSTVFSFIGNLALWGDASGFYTTVPNVPFCLSVVFPVKEEGVFLFTQTAGSHTIKIERIEYTYNPIPNVLIYGGEVKPIYRTKDSDVAYAFYNVGANSIKNRRNSFAFGNCNEISGNGYMAIGSNNNVSGSNAVAVGIRGNATGTGASAFGVQTTSSGTYSQTFGAATESSGMISQANGYGTIANHKSQFTLGEFNVADPSTANANARGNYVEIVGNGTSRNARSNARTLDWDGNEKLAGSLTLGLGTANEVTITPQQLTQLLALLNN